MTLTVREVLELPAVVDVPTAGRALGMGRNKAYALARAGVFPCRVLRAGRTLLVPTADLCRVLGLTVDPGTAADDPVAVVQASSQEQSGGRSVNSLYGRAPRRTRRT